MSRRPLNLGSGMPQMGPAFQGWQKKITVVKITQTIVNGLTVDAEQTISFQGTIQPLSPKNLVLKPEGMRSWKWLQIHAFSGSLNLVDNDRIEYGGDRYKVMGLYDYSLNNFIEYHLVRDFQDGAVE